MSRNAARLASALLALPLLGLVAACGAGSTSGGASAAAAASASAQAEASRQAARVHKQQWADAFSRQAQYAKLDAWLSGLMAPAISRSEQLQAQFGSPEDGCLDGYRYLFPSASADFLTAKIQDAAPREGWTAAPHGGSDEQRFVKGKWELWISHRKLPDSATPDEHGFEVQVSAHSDEPDCG